MSYVSTFVVRDQERAGYDTLQNCKVRTRAVLAMIGRQSVPVEPVNLFGTKDLESVCYAKSTHADSAAMFSAGVPSPNMKIASCRFVPFQTFAFHTPSIREHIAHCTIFATLSRAKKRTLRGRACYTRGPLPLQVRGHRARSALRALGDAASRRRAARRAVDPRSRDLLPTAAHQAELRVLPVQSRRADVWPVLGVPLVLRRHCCLHTRAVR